MGASGLRLAAHADLTGDFFSPLRFALFCFSPAGFDFDESPEGVLDDFPESEPPESEPPESEPPESELPDEDDDSLVVEDESSRDFPRAEPARLSVL
jgi:hypothetical protein